MTQPNESGNVGGTAYGKMWQTDADSALRRRVSENILKLFRKRGGTLDLEVERKIPEFVNRLEEILYRGAATKEEYADMASLERRLSTVAKRMVSAPLPTQQGSQSMPSSSGNMMPTPGSTMIPTPGNIPVEISSQAISMLRLLEKLNLDSKDK